MLVVGGGVVGMHLQLEGEAWRHVVQDLTGVEELHLEIAVDGRFEREDLLAVTAAAPIIKSRVESTRRDLDRGWKRTPLPLLSRARIGGKANLQTLADDHFQRQVGLALDVDDDIVVLAAALGAAALGALGVQLRVRVELGELDELLILVLLKLALAHATADAVELRRAHALALGREISGLANQDALHDVRALGEVERAFLLGQLLVEAELLEDLHEVVPVADDRHGKALAVLSVLDFLTKLLDDLAQGRPVEAGSALARSRLQASASAA